MANTVSILVSADGRGAVRELNRVQGSLTRLDRVGSTTGQRLGRALGTVARAGAYALAGGVVAAGYAMVKSVNSAADFEQQLNVLQAVSGATAGQMRRISAESIRLGKDIHLPATSAQDAAVAMTELTKAGLSVRDAMKAARGTLQLAAAGEIDAATAATVSATALNQFGLAGSQAGHVADLLAGAANASAGEVTDFAEGLQYAGTASHAAGQSIDLTVAALAEMANAGLQGSVAGSSLAQSLRALQAPSAKAQDAIKKYSLSIYDANGNMKPLDQIAQTFTDHLGGLTQKTQNQTLAQIFGSRAVQAARVVFLGGSDALDRYAEKVGKAGNAQRLAEARTKGFRGAIAAFQSNIETLGITLGLTLIPLATQATRELSKLVDVISAVAGAKSPRIALSIVWRGVGKIYDSLDKALFGGIDDATSKLAGARRSIAVPVHTAGLVPQAAGAIAGAIKGINFSDIGRTIAQGISSGLKFTNEQAGNIVKSILAGINANKAQIGTAAAAIALEFISALLDPNFWKDNWKTILAIAISVVPISDLASLGGKVALAILRPFTKILGPEMSRITVGFFEQAFKDGVDNGMVNAIRSIPRRLSGIFRDALFGVETLFRSGFRRIGERILSSLRGTTRIFPNLFQRGFRVVESIATSVFRVIVARIRSLFGAAAKTVERDGAQAFHSVERAARTVGQRILGIIGNIGTFIAKVAVVRAAIGVVQDAFNAVKRAVQDVIHWVENLASAISSLPSLPNPGGFHLGLPGFLHPATGGLVTGGIPGRDSVPALLTPGELVLNKRQQLSLLNGGSGRPIVINLYGFDEKSLKDAARRLQPHLNRASARRA